jgi:hypothetical protein
MMTRAAIGWQTMLADLSLILFMVTAAAMADAPPKAAPRPAPPPPPPPAPAALADPARAQPLAVWREAPGGLGLGPWLAGQQIDSREQLTITLHYPRGAQARALGEAQRLMEEAAARVPAARLVLEPAGAAAPFEALASLAYDRAEGA